eukprot:SAG31_NODE_5638_length_2410_cov_2.118131_1_plen_204_part_00
MFTGLLAETGYLFRIRYIENNIPSLWSTSTRYETAAATVPESPATPNVVGASASTVTLTWGMAVDNGDPVTEYQVECQPDCGDERRKTTIDASTNATTASPASARIVRREEVSGLLAGSEYTFEVRAVNARGLGPAAAALTASTNAEGATVPDAPATPAPGTISYDRVDLDLGELPASEGAQLVSCTISLQPFVSPYAHHDEY